MDAIKTIISGDEFIMGMQRHENKQQVARKLFGSFIGSYSSILYWHIHDGWLTHNYKSGNDVLNHDNIQLTWIDEHAGYSHTHFRPKDGELIAIISDSPDGGDEFSYHSKPFDIHIFKAMVAEYPFGLSHRYNLIRAETFKAIFQNGRYVKYEPPTKRIVNSLLKHFKI